VIENEKSNSFPMMGYLRDRTIEEIKLLNNFLLTFYDVDL